MKDAGIDLLLNTIKRKHGFSSDSALADHIGLTRFAVSSLRNGTKLGPTYILAIHEKTGMPVAEIRTLYRTRAE